MYGFISEHYPYADTTLFEYCSFIVDIEIKKFKYFFFFKIGCSWPFAILYEFEDRLFHFCRKNHRNFESCVKTIDCLG